MTDSCRLCLFGLADLNRNDFFAALMRRLCKCLKITDVFDAFDMQAKRGDAIIEPWLTDQWYVDAKTLAQPALQAVRDGRTRFIPERYANDYFRWLEDIQPC